MHVKIFFVGPKREKENIFKRIEIFTLLKIIYLVLTQRFEPMAFFRELLMFFPGVKFGLYRSYCFDGVVASFNFVKDSL